jgi:hypothetical protein
MSFEQVRADWTRLGAEDPLWAVLVADGKRGGRWDVEEFLALGRTDVARSRGPHRCSRRRGPSTAAGAGARSC